MLLARGGGLCVPVTAARQGLHGPVHVCLRVFVSACGVVGVSREGCVAVGIAYCNHYIAARNILYGGYGSNIWTRGLDGVLFCVMFFGCCAVRWSVGCVTC